MCWKIVRDGALDICSPESTVTEFLDEVETYMWLLHSCDRLGSAMSRLSHYYRDLSEGPKNLDTSEFSDPSTPPAIILHMEEMIFREDLQSILINLPAPISGLFKSKLALDLLAANKFQNLRRAHFLLSNFSPSCPLALLGSQRSNRDGLRELRKVCFRMSFP